MDKWSKILGPQKEENPVKFGFIAGKCLSCFLLSNTPTLQLKVEISSILKRLSVRIEPKPESSNQDSLLALHTLVGF